LQSRIQEIKQADAEVLAVTVDSVSDNASLTRQLGLTFRILSDADRTVIDAYGVRHDLGSSPDDSIARPAVFVIDREGRIAWRNLTDNWRVRVRPEQLLEVLQGLP